MLQTMWSLVPKIISLWKAHQNNVAVNAVAIYLCRNCNVALRPDRFKDYHSWNIKLYRYLIVSFPPANANNVNEDTIFTINLLTHFINVSLASIQSSVVPEKLQFLSPIVFLGLLRCVNLVDIRCKRSNFQYKIIWTKFRFYFLTSLSAIGNLSCHPIFLGLKHKNSKFRDFLALYTLNQLVNNFGLKIINFESLAFNELI